MNLRPLRRLRRSRAFTLMEMVLVMAIIGLVFAGTFVGMSALNDEGILQKPYVQLRGLAKVAWQRAMMDQNSMEIAFYPDRFVLRPRQAANAADDRFIADASRAKGRSRDPEEVKIPEGIMVEIRHWASKVWERPTPDKPVVWIFEESGLLEPLTVVFTGEQGTVGASFDPLTASVKQEIFEREQ